MESGVNRIQDGVQDKRAELGQEFSQGQPKHEILFSFQRKASLTNRKSESQLDLPLTFSKSASGHSHTSRTAASERRSWKGSNAAHRAFGKFLTS